MSAPGAARNVGIGHVEPGEDRGFKAFHGIRLVIRRVIVPDQMKKSMHREVGEMMRKGLVLGACFARGRRRRR